MEYIFLLFFVFFIGYIFGKSHDSKDKVEAELLKSHKSPNEKVTSVEPPISKPAVIPKPVKSLDSHKLKVLESIDTKSLSYEQALAVWDNKSRYSFTVQELKKLELYNAEVKPLTKVYSCRQCGMVGDNCTCDRSWY